MQPFGREPTKKERIADLERDVEVLRQRVADLEARRWHPVPYWVPVYPVYPVYPSWPSYPPVWTGGSWDTANPGNGETYSSSAGNTAGT